MPCTINSFKLIMPQIFRYIHRHHQVLHIISITFILNINSAHIITFIIKSISFIVLSSLFQLNSVCFN